MEVWPCHDCGGNTFLGFNYYMVRDDIWAERGLNKERGLLCWHCMERRMERPITISDLHICLLNSEHVERLLKRNVKMNYNELLVEKTKVRMFNTLRYKVLTMLLSEAAKRAKSELREVTEADLIASAKALIKANEKAIELVEANHGDASESREEIKEYEKFLPKMYTPEQHKDFINEEIQQAVDLTPEKKNMGKYMTRIKARSDASFFDMGIVSKTLQSLLQ